MAEHCDAANKAAIEYWYDELLVGCNSSSVACNSGCIAGAVIGTLVLVGLLAGSANYVYKRNTQGEDQYAREPVSYRDTEESLDHGSDGGSTKKSSRLQFWK